MVDADGVFILMLSYHVISLVRAQSTSWQHNRCSQVMREQQGGRLKRFPNHQWPRVIGPRYRWLASLSTGTTHSRLSSLALPSTRPHSSRCIGYLPTTLGLSYSLSTTPSESLVRLSAGYSGIGILPPQHHQACGRRQWRKRVMRLVRIYLLCMCVRARVCVWMPAYVNVYVHMFRSHLQEY
ncbi:hypothetical protein F4818DRAFT_102420 [Hypoxylon cercidicola]|nr:hypothetical protein F4818DRAFT_102420 [Hypoxylon cercidicola]